MIAMATTIEKKGKMKGLLAKRGKASDELD